MILKSVEKNQKKIMRSQSKVASSHRFYAGPDNAGCEELISFMALR